MINNIPIAIFVYNRVEVLSKTLSALKENFGIEEHTIIFFCDGPKVNATQKDLEKINQVRSLIKKVDWCKNIIIRAKENNFGLANSLVSGITEVLTEYDAIIVLEDDIKTSPYFLKYMVDALNYYKDEERVISISGFNFPIKCDEYPEETFFIRGATCWGWSTWRRGWNLYENNGAKLFAQLLNSKLKRDFEFNNSYKYSKMLLDTIKTNKSWAIKWYASAYFKNKLTLYPKNSLVENIGAGGTNTKNQSTMILGKINSSKFVKYFTNNISESTFMRNQFSNHFSRNYNVRVRILNLIKNKFNFLK